MQQEHAELDAPSRGRRLVLARVLAALTVVSLAIGIVFTILDAAIRPPGSADPLGDLLFVAAFAAFPVIGYVLATRRPENAIGWLMLGMGVFFGLSSITSSLGGYLLHSGHRDAAVLFYAIDSPSWVPIVVLPITFLLLLFPDGHLPSPRWRWFAWSIGIAISLVYLVILLGPGMLEESPVKGATNPLGIEALGPILEGGQALILVIPFAVLGSLLALILRFRRSSGIERLQLRWLLTAAGFVAVFFSVAIIASLGNTWGTGEEPTWLVVLQSVVIPSFALIPIAIGSRSSGIDCSTSML